MIYRACITKLVKEKTLKLVRRQTTLNAVPVGRRIGIKLHAREGSPQINIEIRYVVAQDARMGDID